MVVDDDDGVREALNFLFQSVGLLVTSYASTRAFLAADLPDCPCCLVLDVRMPEESGLELQAKLNVRGDKTPIIFITGHADVPMTVKAMRLGAVNFLPKPFRDQELLDAVWEAIRSDSERRQSEMGLSELRKLAEQLTPRELDVLKLVDRGLLNKQIAFELGLAEVTVKMHRSNAFKKLRATTATDLIQKIRTLDIR
ncbi:response regulator [Chenggangzhangella methanolivorans]|uniref:Response regulator n=1 Tax=Chenggangzhangella methanolivorans TaxID=1437009 RepID=A0A9E6RCH1_9HYPH|nr:response regulator [Chenggangzhangella methanolivorans]